MSSENSFFMRKWSALSAGHQSAALLLAGISILGLSDNFVPYVSEQIGLGHFHFMRSGLALICVIALAVLTGFTLRPVNWAAVLIRTALLASSMGFYFSVLSFLPVAIAGAGLFTSPIFVLLFSMVLFGLRPGWRRVLAVVTGSAGVWFVLRPDSLGFHPLQILPVLAGAFYALSSITTKRLCAEESPLALVAVYHRGWEVCPRVAARGGTAQTGGVTQAAAHAYASRAFFQYSDVVGGHITFYKS